METGLLNLTFQRKSRVRATVSSRTGDGARLPSLKPLSEHGSRFRSPEVTLAAAYVVHYRCILYTATSKTYLLARGMDWTAEEARSADLSSVTGPAGHRIPEPRPVVPSVACFPSASKTGR